jgi:type IV secretory pathway VirB3-like protein
MYILVAIPIVLIMRFIVTFDDFMYSILFQSFKLKTPSLNKKYYGVKTFSSMEYRIIYSITHFSILHT